MHRVILYVGRGENEALQIDLATREEAIACGCAAWVAGVPVRRVDVFDLAGVWARTINADGQLLELRPGGVRPGYRPSAGIGVVHPFRYRDENLN